MHIRKESNIFNLQLSLFEYIIFICLYISNINIDSGLPLYEQKRDTILIHTFVTKRKLFTSSVVCWYDGISMWIP